MMTITPTPSPESNSPVHSLVSPKLDSPEAFKAKGFIALNETILKGTDQLYLYFYEGKPLLMISCDVLLKDPFFDRIEYDSFLIEPYLNCLNMVVQGHKAKESPYYRHIVLDGQTLSLPPRREHWFQEEEGNPHYGSRIPRHFPSELTGLGFQEQILDPFFSFEPFQTQEEVKERLKRELEVSKMARAQMEQILTPLLKSHSNLIALFKKQSREYFAFLNRKIEFVDLESGKPFLSNKAALHEIQIYTKKIPGPSPRVFMVICKQNKLLNILTAVSCIKQSGQYYEIKGEIRDVELKERPLITFYDRGKKRQLQFPSSRAGSSDAHLFSFDEIS